MKAILAAAKKPVAVRAPQDVGFKRNPLVESVSVLAPRQKDRKNIIIEGDSDEQIAAFAVHVRNLVK
jgi:electron transfer flavoprotein beta subunit